MQTKTEQPVKKKKKKKVKAKKRKKKKENEVLEQVEPYAKRDVSTTKSSPCY